LEIIHRARSCTPCPRRPDRRLSAVNRARDCASGLEEPADRASALVLSAVPLRTRRPPSDDARQVALRKRRQKVGLALYGGAAQKALAKKLRQSSTAHTNAALARVGNNVNEPSSLKGSWLLGPQPPRARRRGRTHGAPPPANTPHPPVDGWLSRKCSTTSVARCLVAEHTHPCFTMPAPMHPVAQSPPPQIPSRRSASGGTARCADWWSATWRRRHHASGAG
jgi:hypothetical protein